MAEGLRASGLLLLASLACCGASSEDDVVIRGGAWQVTVELSGVDFPGLSEEQQEAFVARMRTELPGQSSQQCWVARTRSNYLRPGVPANVSPRRDLSCRYTAVEEPGEPVDRTAECREADGRLHSVLRTTGTAAPTEYEYDIELLDTASGRRVFTKERGRWLTDECRGGD